MIKVAVNGALGRMGTRIIALAKASKDYKICGEFDFKGDAQHRLSAKNLKGADALIDFSSAQGTQESVKVAVRTQTPLVIGTTGVDAPAEAQIKNASRRIPILYSPNMSVGANFLFELARLAAAKLKKGYDIEIIEAHHRLKKDAPSGTAKKIAQVIAKEKGWDMSRVAKYGRQGFTGERAHQELGIHVIRAGDIVGEHTVLFSGSGETIELTHRAQSRDAFAQGALYAASFLQKKKPGLYTMADVLGL